MIYSPICLFAPHNIMHSPASCSSLPKAVRLLSHTYESEITALVTEAPPCKNSVLVCRRQHRCWGGMVILQYESSSIDSPADTFSQATHWVLVPYRTLSESFALAHKERGLSGLSVLYDHLHFVGFVRGRIFERAVTQLPSLKCRAIMSSTPWSMSDTQSSLCKNTYANFVHGLSENLREGFDLWRTLNVFRQGGTTEQYISNSFHC